MTDSIARFGTDAFDLGTMLAAVKIESGGILIDAKWFYDTVPSMYREGVSAIIGRVSESFIGQKVMQWTKDIFVSELRRAIFSELRGPDEPDLDDASDFALWVAKKRESIASTYDTKQMPIPRSISLGDVAELREETYVSDNRPSRFSMIAEEMTAEIKPKVTDVRPGDAYTLRVDAAGKSECPRCGCGAFAPISRGGLNAVVCLGCPLPSPIFEVPDGMTFKTSRYRCGSCGKQVAVTLDLSDVNLHCSGCGKLSLHARQADPTPVIPAPYYQDPTVKFVTGSKAKSRPTTLSGRIMAQWLPLQSVPPPDTLRRQLDDFDRWATQLEPRMPDTLAGPDLSDWAREFLGVPTPPSSSDNSFDTVRAMIVVALGLEDPQAFAARMRDANREAGVSAKYLERRTGRTTRILVDAFARCQVGQFHELRIRGVNRAHCDGLRSMAMTMMFNREVNGRLGFKYPTIVTTTFARPPAPRPSSLPVLDVDDHLVSGSSR